MCVARSILPMKPIDRQERCICFSSRIVCLLTSSCWWSMRSNKTITIEINMGGFFYFIRQSRTSNSSIFIQIQTNLFLDFVDNKTYTKISEYSLDFRSNHLLIVAFTRYTSFDSLILKSYKSHLFPFILSLVIRFDDSPRSFVNKISVILNP